MKINWMKQSLAAAAVTLLPLTMLGLTRAPTPPLAERVQKAKKIFVGTLVNRVQEGEWVQAELRVDEALRNVEKGQRIAVIWRREVGGTPIYDAQEKARGVAILDDQHKGRYWLRGDKFEPISNLKAVKALMDKDTSGTPTFEEWVKQGKPLPEGMMFAGGSPWFNERTGTKRSPEEVYQMLYGGKSAKPKPATTKAQKAAKKTFPNHWGEPPRAQTRDLRPLPGGYGKGSSTLAKWIERNMAADAAKNK